MEAGAVLRFWFEELERAAWYRSDQQLDQTIAARFGDAHEAAGRGELFAWRDTPAGRLAEIVILDQFSRNIHRDTARAYAADGMALVLAQEAISAGAAAALPAKRRAFLYMPFMHSESVAIHEVALTLFAEPGLEHNLAYEHKHLAVLREFGRYPHRNAALGRLSTAAELEYLGRAESGF